MNDLIACGVQPDDLLVAESPVESSLMATLREKLALLLAQLPPCVQYEGIETLTERNFRDESWRFKILVRLTAESEDLVNWRGPWSTRR